MKFFQTIKNALQRRKRRKAERERVAKIIRYMRIHGLIYHG